MLRERARRLARFRGDVLIHLETTRGNKIAGDAWSWKVKKLNRFEDSTKLSPRQTCRLGKRGEIPCQRPKTGLDCLPSCLGNNVAGKTNLPAWRTKENHYCLSDLGKKSNSLPARPKGPEKIQTKASSTKYRRPKGPHYSFYVS